MEDAEIGMSLGTGARLCRWGPVVLCCPLINKVWGGWGERMLWDQATHVIGVEFGLIFFFNALKAFTLFFGVGWESQLGLLFLIPVHYVPGTFGSGS